MERNAGERQRAQACLIRSVVTSVVTRLLPSSAVVATVVAGESCPPARDDRSVQVGGPPAGGAGVRQNRLLRYSTAGRFNRDCQKEEKRLGRCAAQPEEWGCDVPHFAKRISSIEQGQGSRWVSTGGL